MGFIGNFADLTGYEIGSFVVHSLAGRDGQNAPRWTVVWLAAEQFYFWNFDPPNEIADFTPNTWHSVPGGYCHRVSESISDCL